MRHALVRLLGVSVAAAVLFCPASASAQDGKTISLVTELVKLLEAAKADSMAAHVPGSPDTFVGVLYIPGSQLLVVSAKYAVPQYLEEKLAKKAYQEIYIDLNSASVPNSKVFVSDLGADGLKARRRTNEPYDTVEVSGKTTAFDGDWAKAKISEKEYMSAFDSAEGQYVKMLEALVAQLKKPS
jgi:hypothetical protein